MKKFQPLLTAGALFVLAGVAFIFYMSQRGETPSTDDSSTSNFSTVQSDDGQAELKIPEGALPEGVAVSDIQITPATAEEIASELQFESVEESSTLLAYNLLPDGLELTKPVTITINHDTNPGQVIPAIFHVANGEMDLILDTKVTIAPDTGATSVSGDITHFSRVGSDFGSTFGRGKGMFNYELISGGVGYVGDSFPFKFTITPTEDFTWFEGMGGLGETWGYEYRMAPVTPWKVGHFLVLTRHDGVIAPMGITSSSVDLKGSEIYTLEDTHTCIEEGTNTLFVPPGQEITIEYRMEKKFINYKGEEATRYKNGTTDIFLTSLGFFECKKMPEQQ